MDMFFSKSQKEKSSRKKVQEKIMVIFSWEHFSNFQYFVNIVLVGYPIQLKEYLIIFKNSCGEHKLTDAKPAMYSFISKFFSTMD